MPLERRRWDNREFPAIFGPVSPPQISLRTPLRSRARPRSEAGYRRVDRPKQSRPSNATSDAKTQGLGSEILCRRQPALGDNPCAEFVKIVRDIGPGSC